MLYKLNLVSLQAVQSPEIIAQVAERRAVDMAKVSAERQSGALNALYASLAAVLLAGLMVLAGNIRMRGAPGHAGA